MAPITFCTCSQEEELEITQFLWSLKDDLLFTDKKRIAETVNLLFDKGGAAAAYHNNTMVAMVGYFLGEPSQNYTNQETGFVYVTGIAKEYRLSRLFLSGMDYTFRHLKKEGIKEIRCHASIHDPYTNRLYSHFANRLGEDQTLSGRKAVLYGATMNAVIAYLDKMQKQAARTLLVAPHLPTG